MSQSNNFFYSFFIEKIFLVRYRKEKLFFCRAIFCHVNQRDYSCSRTNENFGQLCILENKVTKYSLNHNFTAYGRFFNHSTPSSIV